MLLMRPNAFGFATYEKILMHPAVRLYCSYKYLILRFSYISITAGAKSRRPKPTVAQVETNSETDRLVNT